MAQRLCLLLTSLLVLVFSTPIACGQTFDSVTFLDVTPDVVGSGDYRSYVIQNGGNARSLNYSGTITEINTITYVNEVSMQIFGSGFSVANQILSQMSDFTGMFDFSGVIPIETVVEPGDLWSFIFTETLDDGSDGIVDASVDITFEFSSSPAPQPTVSELGIFGLDQGTYQRGDQAGTEFPYRVVPIEVSEPGDYTLRLDWQDIDQNTSFDGYLYLLGSPFAGTDSVALISNDDYIDTSTSLLTTSLEPGQTYYALLTTFSQSPVNSAFQGNFSISTFDGGAARVVVIPEPANTAILAFTFAATCLRRQRALFGR